VGEFVSTHIDRNSSIPYSYKLSDLASLVYTIPYQETFPGNATLTGVTQTVRLPNGANFTSIIAVSDKATYNDVDNWRVNISKTGMKLSYTFSNWPPNSSDLETRGVFIRANHTVRFIAREDAQGFPIFLDVADWPLSIRDSLLKDPYDVVNLTAPISPPPEMTQSVYNDRRAQSVRIDWFRRSKACDNVTSPGIRYGVSPDLAFFRLTGEDVMAALQSVKGAFRAEPIPFDLSLPVFLGLYGSNYADFMEWDPNFDVLFLPPPESPEMRTPEAIITSQTIDGLSTGALAAIIVVVAVVVIAGLTIGVLREKIFPFFRGRSPTTKEDLDHHGDDSDPKASWKAASRPPTSV
jgi:hypothetical protein